MSKIRGNTMGKVVLGFTVSLDGFAEDTSRSVNSLYPDHEFLVQTEYMKESILTTGSVVMSLKEYEMADDVDLYADYYEYQVPIFVVTDHVPDKHPKENDALSFTFVTTGYHDAILKAKIAAKFKDVNIIGSALTTMPSLETKLVDELQIDTIPILLKEGYKPFEKIEGFDIEFERINVLSLPEGRVHVSYQCFYKE
jgi:dihydrofolate reductase